MPTFNTTLEDYSPWITYSTDWRPGTSDSDSLADLYSDSSFTLTQTDGATASFSFNGSAVTIFGSKRGNHGFYQVTIDGNTFPPASGQAADPGQFQVPLFSSPVLDQGLHSVTFTNQGSTFVDIDFITFENTVGETTEPLIVRTVQDDDPSFVYSSVWGTNVPALGTFSGSTGHGTATPGAFVTYTFEGDSVFLYGPVGPAASPFTVSLDGGAPVNYSANKQFYKSQVLLYGATNLGQGRHQIKVSYQPSQPGQILAIDYANVYTTASLGGTGTSTLSSANGSSNSSSGGLSGGAVAAIIIALLFVLFVLAALVFFLRRRKHRKDRTLPTPIQAPPMRNQDIVAASIVYNPAPQPRPSMRYPSTIIDSYYVNRAFDAQSQEGGSTSSESNYGGVKGQPPPLPSTAGQSLSHIPDAELRANRRVVAGRQQDFGPVAPPDYIQATEPYPVV